jgi:F-type H+-transporting ATPase subunit delta
MAMRSTKKSRRIARQLFQLCRVGDRLDPDRVRQVGARLAGARERAAVAVIAQFGRLVRLELARHAALIESAAPLDADVRGEVEAELTRLHGAGLEVSSVVDPALIAGMRITVGSVVYDGSVRGRLDTLARQL